MNTLWHRLFAKLLEQVLTPVQVTVLSELPATSNPPQIDLLLLRRDGVHWTPEQMALLPDGVRDRHAAHHLLECKITESVTEQSLQQALTYEYLYTQSQQLSADALQTYVVSAQTPQAAKLTTWGYTASEYPGVYVTSAPLLNKVVLLVLNELRDEQHNEYFRLFASRQRVRRTALRSLGQEQADAVWTVVLALQKVYELEGEGMNTNVTLDSLLTVSEDLRKKIVASASLKERLAGIALQEWLAGLGPEERLAGLGPEERLAGLGPEERLAGLGPEERLAGLGPEERLAGLGPEERLAGLGPEELQALWLQLDRYLGQRINQPSTPAAAALQEKKQILLRVLRHKFGELPVAIVERVETTTDATQLNFWLDQALDAVALAEILFDRWPG